MNDDSLANAYLSASGLDCELVRLKELGTESFANSLKIFQASLSQVSDLASNIVITPALQEALDSLVSSIGAATSDSIISSCKSMIEELAKFSSGISEDYVTLDKPEITELELPDSIALPIGNKRIRMSTSIFIAIISSILLPILFHLSDTIVNLYQSSAEVRNEQKRLEIEQEKNDLIRERNQIYKQCLDAFESLDVSHSSQSETIESWKESLPVIDSYPEESELNHH